MACGWINVVALLQLGQPSIRLIGRHVLTSGAEGLPRLKSILAKGFPLFLTVDVLRDRFTHQPVRLTLACICQAPDAGFGVLVDLDRYSSNSSNSHNSLQYGIDC
jgi:hypothetical protein